MPQNIALTISILRNSPEEIEFWIKIPYTYTMTLKKIAHLAATSGLHPDDTREVIRIFECLTDTRKLAILDTWGIICTRIKLHREIVEAERLIMIADPLNALVDGYETLIKKVNSYTVRQDLQGLQTQTNN